MRLIQSNVKFKVTGGSIIFPEIHQLIDYCKTFSDIANEFPTFPYRFRKNAYNKIATKLKFIGTPVKTKKGNFENAPKNAQLCK